MKKLLYDNYIRTLSNKFTQKLDLIAAKYNFDLGDEFEAAICQILREFLPQKYGVCRGFVVSANGTYAGDDIIIFDQERFPTLRLLEKDDFLRKEFIPIEAVYAYIEAKHTLTKEAFDKALVQVSDIKKLCSQRAKINIYQHDPYIESKSTYIPENMPEYRNPVFGMIISRFSVDLTDKKSSNAQEIAEFLEEQRKSMIKNDHNPEIIVAGNSNFLCTGYRTDTRDIPSMFYLANKKIPGYQNMLRENITFGIALAHLIAALDWIRLGTMPWAEILNNAKVDD